MCRRPLTQDQSIIRIFAYFGVILLLPLYTVWAQKDGWFPAAYQQTFRYQYRKVETGACPQPLTTYSGVLQAAAQQVAQALRLLPCRGPHANLTVSGQLTIADVEDQPLTINVEVSFVQDDVWSSPFEYCRGPIQEAFLSANSSATASFRQTFSPLQCPQVTTDDGAQEVSSGFVCKDPSQVYIQTASSRTDDTVKPLEGLDRPADGHCEYCPGGSVRAIGSNTCSPCPHGYYKSDETLAFCSPCPLGFTTRFTGATSLDDCWIGACPPGYYYANETGVGLCHPCPLGAFQPHPWQHTCLPCPTGRTTYRLAADTLDHCLADCPAGQELVMVSDETTGSCRLCPLGHFNDDLDPWRTSCRKCVEDYITPGPGATSSQNCTVRNCTASGQYRDPVDNVCRDCPIGRWQNLKWQTFCHFCPQGMTSERPGTSDPAQCIRPETGAILSGELRIRQEVAIVVLVVLAVALVGNVILLIYCIYSRKQRGREQANARGDTADCDPAKKWPGKSSGSADSVDYEDINLYSIIRDVFPRQAASSYHSSAGLRDSGKHPDHAFYVGKTDWGQNYRFLAACKEYSFALPVAVLSDSDPVQLQTFRSTEVEPAGQPHCPAGDADEDLYDDITNTGPIYENMTFEPQMVETSRNNLSSTLDTLY